MDANVFAIVVTYNGQQYIKECLRSILRNGCVNKIVIVDNGSTDETRDILRGYSGRVLTIFNEKNLGFGAANNIGIKLALKQGAEYILLVNQDLYVTDYTVGRLIDVVKADETIGICAPCQIGNADSQPDVKFKYHINRYTKDQFYGWERRLTNTLLEVKFVNAAIWLIRSETISAVGGFNKLFFHYGEDEDYCRRVIYNDYKIIVDMQNIVIHDRRISDVTNMKGIYYMERSKIYIELLDKHYSKFNSFGKYLYYSINRQWKYLLTGNYRMAWIYMRIAIMLPFYLYQAINQKEEKLI